MTYSDILDTIYQHYYLNFDKHSDVTSSFWRSFGNRHRIRKKGDKWEIFGYGLGSFVNKSLRPTIRHYPAIWLSKRLLKDYDCHQKLIDTGYAVSDSSGRIFNFDCAKQVLAVNAVLQQLSGSMDDNMPLSDTGIKTVCVIGDGYGFCSSILKSIDPGLRVVCVNLGRSLFFDVLFSEKCMHDASPALITDASDKQAVFKSHNLIFMPAEHYELLKGLPIDLFISITAMQEMNPETIHRYFDYIRESAAETIYFYCCSRIEKILPDNTVVRFMDYPWNNSQILLDELCPWHQKYPEAGIPIWRKFDGPIQHRFVKM